MRKVLLIVCISIPVIFWSIWFAFPENSIQSLIEGSSADDRLNLSVKNLRKGLFYTLTADNIELNNFKKELFSFDNINGHINPLDLIMLHIKLSFQGNFAGGNISGDLDIGRKTILADFVFENANIVDIPILEHAGIKGTALVSGRFIMKNNKGHVDFAIKGAKFEPTVFSGNIVPLNFFHDIIGSVDIHGDTLHIVSVTLEGSDIYARLKGSIREAAMDMKLELMPEKIFIENPLFSSAIERYEVAPGYYVIPVRGNI